MPASFHSINFQWLSTQSFVASEHPRARSSCNASLGSNNGGGVLAFAGEEGVEEWKE